MQITPIWEAEAALVANHGNRHVRAFSFCIIICNTLLSLGLCNFELRHVGDLSQFSSIFMAK